MEIQIIHYGANTVTSQTIARTKPSLIVDGHEVLIGGILAGEIDVVNAGCFRFDPRNKNRDILWATTLKGLIKLIADDFGAEIREGA